MPLPQPTKTDYVNVDDITPTQMNNIGENLNALEVDGEILRAVKGSLVNTSQSSGSGAGYTYTRNSIGDITINYNIPFSGSAVVTCTPFDTTFKPYITFHSSGSSSVGIRTYSDFGITPAEGIFSFIAIGPA